MTALTRLNSSNISLALLSQGSDFKHIDTTPSHDRWHSFFKLAEANLTKEEISKNFIDDFAYILLAKGMINTSLKVEHNKQDADIVSVKKGDYHTIKQINRRIETLYKELDSLADKYFYVIPKSAKKSEKMLNSILALRDGNLQLDYLACYILKMRFMPFKGRKEPIHNSMQWITSKGGQLMAIMELLDKTDEAAKEEKMAELAKYVCKNL